MSSDVHEHESRRSGLRRPRYGVDAPAVPAVLGAAGVACGAAFAGVLLLANAAVYLHTTLRGSSPGANVLSVEVGPARQEEAARLRINAGDDVLRLQRVRTPDDEPVMVERSRFSEVVTEHILAMDLTSGSITEQLTALGFVHAHGDHLIDAVSATTLEARLLGVRRGTPLLRQRSLASSPTGQPLAWPEDSSRHDAVIISVRNSMSANTLARLRAGARTRPGPEADAARREGEGDSPRCA